MLPAKFLSLNLLDEGGNGKNKKMINVLFLRGESRWFEGEMRRWVINRNGGEILKILEAPYVSPNWARGPKTNWAQGPAQTNSDIVQISN